MKPTFFPTASVLDDSDKALDDRHHSIFEALKRAQHLQKEQFAEAFAAIVNAIELDFHQEGDLMDRFQCPDSHLHREQHAQMLAGLHSSRAPLLAGDCGPARQALAAIATFLPFHIATQDRHLFRWLKRLSQEARRENT
jgi:hemerythrin-like metal-binding protein